MRQKTQIAFVLILLRAFFFIESASLNIDSYKTKYFKKINKLICKTRC
jgi:hypothetical protein